MSTLTHRAWDGKSGKPHCRVLFLKCSFIVLQADPPAGRSLFYKRSAEVTWNTKGLLY